MEYDIIGIQNAFEELVQPTFTIKYNNSETTDSIIEPLGGKFRGNPALFKVLTKKGRNQFLITLSETLQEDYERENIELTFVQASDIEKRERDRERDNRRDKEIYPKLQSESVRFNIADTVYTILATTGKRSVGYNDILRVMVERGAIIKGFV